MKIETLGAGIKVPALWQFTILDRYILSELGGPFSFGVAAFMLIFIASNLIQLSHLVTDDHAPLAAAIEYFLWQLPQVLFWVIPMAMLLGVLLSLQRLSGESEITAMKAGGVSLERITAPLLIVGFMLSLANYYLQETVVPYANDRATEIMEITIRHAQNLGNSLTVYSPLPGGGRQLTAATAYDATNQALLNVTVIQYDAHGSPQLVLFSDRARASNGASSWDFENARTYRFNPDGEIVESTQRLLALEIGETPDMILKRARGSPQLMSRGEIANIVRSGQLNATGVRQYVAEYQAQLARPFACFVFALIAIPFGLRRVRGGGTSVGFGIAVGIIFLYYVVMTISNSIGEQGNAAALVMAWFPNLLFTAIGLYLLRRASYGAI
ncbi:MAG: LptF/LptG family permease [Candidatus Eremiobacteraeota bacterium]|nr:LptF/LptG family permease [Candidatus Eremiobacteraeota bacterium]MBV8353857.1 LptF/LptG family permease [Candidatus Eremiobacteraeota bacterium]